LVTLAAELYFALNQGLATNPQPAAETMFGAFQVVRRNHGGGNAALAKG
jgi:hypothetical protein